MAEKVQIVEALPRLPARRADAHKGDFGRVLIIGGSRGMVGAVALAARAALRSGAGLVTMAVPACIQQTVAALCPSATSIALPDTTDGTISATAPELFADDEEFALPYDVVAIGPGLGRTESSDRAVELFVELFGEVALLPVVIDADALNALAESDRLAGTHNFRTIITPHPGELARLLHVSSMEVQADRRASALRAARRFGRGGRQPQFRTVVVLKGAGTIVTDGRRMYINDTGNPGMATGGAGDTLTGMIAALLAQGLSRFDACCLGVYLHGLAGDLAAGEIGQVCMTAEDIIDYLPRAFARV